MQKDFLGRGWKFPIQVDENGAIAFTSQEEKVHESIMIILNTIIGERTMEPKFGSGLQNLVFEPINSGTFAAIADQVREALIEWEPRIDVLKVESSPDLAESGKLLVNIEYQIRATNMNFNLVYPFYLGGSDV